MPRYDFKCTNCGHVFEEVVHYRIKHLPCKECLTHDPEIVQYVAERQLSAPAVIAIH